MATVRPISAEDYAGWRPLWEGYLSFYREEGEPPDVFGRLLGDDALSGLLAVDAADRPVGLAHLVFHASTWSDKPSCYLNDLFVAREARGGGVGRELIVAAYAAAGARGCATVYWHTQEFNAPARSLYETVARLTSFRVYEHEL
jgi:GNAT superfamily N-acetyltransferase